MSKTPRTPKASLPSTTTPKTTTKLLKTPTTHTKPSSTSTPTPTPKSKKSIQFKTPNEGVKSTKEVGTTTPGGMKTPKDVERLDEMNEGQMVTPENQTPRRKLTRQNTPYPKPKLEVEEEEEEEENEEKEMKAKVSNKKMIATPQQKGLTPKIKTPKYKQMDDSIDLDETLADLDATLCNNLDSGVLDLEEDEEEDNEENVNINENNEEENEEEENLRKQKFEKVGGGEEEDDDDDDAPEEISLTTGKEAAKKQKQIESEILKKEKQILQEKRKAREERNQLQKQNKKKPIATLPMELLEEFASIESKPKESVQIQEESKPKNLKRKKVFKDKPRKDLPFKVVKLDDYLKPQAIPQSVQSFQKKQFFGSRVSRDSKKTTLSSKKKSVPKLFIQ